MIKGPGIPKFFTLTDVDYKKWKDNTAERR